MHELEIPLNGGLSSERAAALVEAVAAAEGLHVSLRGTLAQYPGSLHWHLARPGQRGALEVTYWPTARRLWLAVQDGRRAEWVAEALASMPTQLAVREAPAST